MTATVKWVENWPSTTLLGWRLCSSGTPVSTSPVLLRPTDLGDVVAAVAVLVVERGRQVGRRVRQAAGGIGLDACRGDLPNLADTRHRLVRLGVGT